MLLHLAATAFARDAALLCAERVAGEADATREEVLQKGWFDTMEPLPVGTSTPTVGELLAYDAVLVYPNEDFADPDALAAALAGYVEAGGGVVLGFGAFSDAQGLGDAFAPYQPLLAGPRDLGGVDLVPVVPDHPILVGTTVFDAALGTRTDTPGTTAGAVLVATWGDGVPLAATLEVGLGRVVALNLLPSPGSVVLGSWDVASDVDDLLARSLLWTTGFEWPFATACWSGTTVERDRNCNGVDASLEAPVDPADPGCAASPWPNRDEYADYDLWGCRYPVAAYDPDGDGFGAGEFDVTDPVTGALLYVRKLSCDNCGEEWNPQQEDIDCDESGDVCDPCVEDPGSTSNEDEDPFGDGCDLCPHDFNLDPPPDTDGDSFADCVDNCPEIANPDQGNADFDAWGTVCDLCPTVWSLEQDTDEDGVGDGCDNCIDVANPDQANDDDDDDGDACDPCPQIPHEPGDDADDDGQPDVCDACPDLPASSHPDHDGDGVGDACDLCPDAPDVQNGDLDLDGAGDVCDTCPRIPGTPPDADGDGLGDPCDVCPDVADDQRDGDRDGAGDACDACPTVATEPDANDGDRDGVPDVCDRCPIEPGDTCTGSSGLLLRGGGTGCATAPGTAAWLGLLALLGVRCSSRR